MNINVLVLHVTLAETEIWKVRFPPTVTVILPVKTRVVLVPNVTRTARLPDTVVLSASVIVDVARLVFTSAVRFGIVFPALVSVLVPVAVLCIRSVPAVPVTVIPETNVTFPVTVI